MYIDANLIYPLKQNIDALGTLNSHAPCCPDEKGGAGRRQHDRMSASVGVQTNVELHVPRWTANPTFHL